MSKVDLLNALKVARLKAPGVYLDGKGLYLQVLPSKKDNERRVTKSWLYRFMLNSRSREMGLGAFPDVSLAKAREKAAAAREQVKVGIDPIEARRKEREASATEAAKAAARVVTFDQCRDACIAAHEDAWRGKRYRVQMERRLARYVTPVFGKLPVKAVDEHLVLQVLQPLWKAKPPTAKLVRESIEAILDWARVAKYREGENPARWKGHLDHMLPSIRKVHKVKHHAALPYTEIHAFLTALRSRDGASARALEFAILTATSSNEAMGATWDEISLADKLWTIPGERMKGGKEHRVPLNDAALKILKQMAEQRHDAYVFPGKGRGALSPMMFLKLLRRMGRADLTAHGFRATFKTWASDCTDIRREVVETALAHAVGDATEQAYERGDRFERRRVLMEAWAWHCSREPTKVLEFSKRRQAPSA
jgi:integrase